METSTVRKSAKKMSGSKEITLTVKESDETEL
jgi:hypothetical protein